MIYQGYITFLLIPILILFFQMQLNIPRQGLQFIVVLGLSETRRIILFDLIKCYMGSFYYLHLIYVGYAMGAFNIDLHLENTYGLFAKLRSLYFSGFNELL